MKNTIIEDLFVFKIYWKMTREQAQRRNYLKFRLLGSVLNTDNVPLSDEENATITDIKNNISNLISNWDNNSKLFVTDKKSTLFKKYKCWCGLKTNVLRKMLDYDNTEIYVCKKHFEEMKEFNPNRIIETK